MNENICRLCLKTASDNNFQIIGDTLRDILDKLLLKLDLTISKNAVMCTQCVENLQVSSNFKSMCVYSKEKILSSTELNSRSDLDLNGIDIINGELNEVSNDEKICYFCTKPTEAGNFILLNETKENVFTVDMLQKYIAELQLNNSEELVTCKTCFESLQSLLDVVTNYSNIEEKIKKFIEIRGSDDKGQIELYDVQQFVVKPILKHEVDCNAAFRLKGAHDGNNEGTSVKVELETKSDEDCGVSDLKIEPEEVDVKPIKSNWDSSQTSLPGSHEILTEIPMFNCEICTFRTKYKKNLKKHILTHTNGKTPKKRMICHKDASNIYHCVECSYQTAHRRYLYRHMITHKSISEIPTFQCETCSFRTKYKKSIKKHMLTHERQKLLQNLPLEAQAFKCNECAFGTNLKSRLKRHMLVHQDASEIKMYKCEVCSFQTKQKSNLNSHIALMHQDASKITMHKCEYCSYQTKYKSALKAHHKRMHKNDDVCDYCSFRIKNECTLKADV